MERDLRKFFRKTDKLVSFAKINGLQLWLVSRAICTAFVCLKIATILWPAMSCPRKMLYIAPEFIKTTLYIEG